ncbi:DUF29 domain-containing protein [Cronbergia sp. UHCC 0137]|uniref:DUF29 domain-containing protein n=1 Tax=Cronbergia sp. UHCC 0137 TaxID=3110239 RepID=UPI002B219C1C|nr:DUF29 domain-containing protein [Cronbergia sp. UHCC 0137]MEA5619747.1 DUF29 domain-containing protein [Cronbergia sp. UHCC 0137]
MSLYTSDFYAWTQEQAKALKNQQWEQLDLANLLEEIEALGRRERQELRNRLGILLGHFLKWEYQPEKRGNSWIATIREQRRELLILLEENPSLKSYLEEVLEISYQKGLDLAVYETGLSYSTFPVSSPYSFVQILEQEFVSFDS